MHPFAWGSTYDWLRGLHIIAVIAWMAGMMMLPRIFVYHMSAEPGSKMDQVFKDAERRLLRIVLNPAMILAFALGCALTWYTATCVRGDGWGFLAEPWMMVKLLGVVFMVSWHGFLARSRRHF